MKDHEIKQKAKLLRPTIQIGKNGVTESLIEEIKKQIKKSRLVKIKLLKGFVEANDRKKVSKEIADETDSVLIDQVGNVIVLRKK
jgi:RNA-binding protein